MLHNTPGDQATVQNYPVRSHKCKAVAQTRTSRLVITSLPLRRVAINLHPQQVTVELLVELGKMYLPDAAKAQQAIDQCGVSQDAVLHMVDIERPEELLHDQAHLDHTRTDLRGPGILQIRGKQSRNRVIGNIEVKFTDYLRGSYQTVNSEVETLIEMLARSTTEVREYQAELMVAAQDDIGSTMRIEELERRTNLAGNVAQRINDKGMIMREEYQDQVQHLHGLLLHTEDRVRQMESESE